MSKLNVDISRMSPTRERTIDMVDSLAMAGDVRSRHPYVRLL